MSFKIINSTDFEIYCIDYHQKKYNQKSWHWKDIPIDILIKSGFIHDYNELLIKKKDFKEKKYSNPIREYGLDGISLEIKEDGTEVYHGIQCKLWNQGCSITSKNLGSFLEVIFMRMKKKNINSKGYLYHTCNIQKDLKESFKLNDDIIHEKIDNIMDHNNKKDREKISTIPKLMTKYLCKYPDENDLLEKHSEDGLLKKSIEDDLFEEPHDDNLFEELNDDELFKEPIDDDLFKESNDDELFKEPIDDDLSNKLKEDILPKESIKYELSNEPSKIQLSEKPIKDDLLKKSIKNSLKKNNDTIIQQKCVRCKNVFINLFDLKRHLNRKKKCVSNDPNFFMSDEQVIKKSIQPRKNSYKKTTIDIALEKKKEVCLTCPFCQRLYPSKSRLTQHKKTCKKRIK